MDDPKSEREQRLAAALRANLVRRKDEARRPAETDKSGEPGQTRPGAGSADGPADKR